MFFNLFSSKPKGLIAYFDLIPFWDSFSLEQQQYLRHMHNSGLNVNPRSLTDIEIEKTSQSKLSFLQTFIQSAKVDSDEEIFKKVIDEAEKSILQCDNIIDIHFYFQSLIIYYYRKRKNKEFYELAKKSCLRQIEIADEVKKSFIREDDRPLPRHYGFKQYSIILEKERKFEEAVALCILANDQGWNGDWPTRIEKLRNKVPL